MLERSGITSGISKAPAGLSGSGCSYCVTVSEPKIQNAVAVLRRENMLSGKIYKQEKDGTTREVFL